MDYGFVLRSAALGGSDPSCNFFSPVSEKVVVEAERRIGVQFAPALRAFYLQVGCGFLKRSVDGRVASTFNRIVGPLSVADAHVGESEMAPPEGFGSDELPVFEVSEESFIVMRPWGRDVDAVYRRDGSVVASGFMEFVRRLFFEDPEFFLRR